MRSKLEIAWAEYFDSNKTAWEYEIARFHRYTPDFALCNRRIFVEVKSPEMLGLNDVLSCALPLILVVGVPPEPREVYVQLGRCGGLHRTLDWNAALFQAIGAIPSALEAMRVRALGNPRGRFVHWKQARRLDDLATEMENS